MKTILYSIIFTFYSFSSLASNIEGKGLVCVKYHSYLKYNESKHVGYWFTMQNIAEYIIEGYQVKKTYKTRYKVLTRHIEWKHESCPNEICILNRETLKISDYQCIIIKTKLEIINKLESYIEDQKRKNKI